MKTSASCIILILISLITVDGKSNNVDAELITNIKSIQPGKDFYVALRLSAKPDWHTYWRNPGDSGLPTSIEWDLPEGFTHAPIEWPIPKIFEVEGITNYGYDDKVLLLIKITPSSKLNEGDVVTLRAKATWLACRVECVPESETVSLTIPVKNEISNTDNYISEQFNNFIASLPLKDFPVIFNASLNDNSVIISAENKSFDLSELKDLRFFPYEAGYFNNSADQILKVNGNSFSLKVLLDDFKIGIPNYVSGILYSPNGWGSENSKAIELKIKISK